MPLCVLSVCMYMLSVFVFCVPVCVSSPVQEGVSPDQNPSVRVMGMQVRLVGLLGFRKQPTGQLYSATASASRDVKVGTLMLSSSRHSSLAGVGGSGHIPPAGQWYMVIIETHIHLYLENGI